MNPFWVLFWIVAAGPVAVWTCIGLVHWRRARRRAVGRVVMHYYNLDDGEADYYHLSGDETRDVYWRRPLPIAVDPWGPNRV